MNILTFRPNYARRCAALARTVVALGLASFLTGCPAGKEEAPPASGDKIVIRGSNTFGEELAPKLIAAYKKDHPKAEFDIESKATSYGFAALLAGKCDVAAASRPPLKEELERAGNSGVQMNEYVVGSFTVAVIVNSANPVANLTRDQVADVFSGKVKNWKEVGGPDAPVALYIRDPISGVNLGFKELALGSATYSSESKLFTDYGAIVKMVAADSNGIGYASLDAAKNSGVKSISINGVEPSVTTVHQGNYPYSRVVRLHTAKGHESDSTRDFIKFVQSDAGKEIVTHTGFTP